MRNTQYTVRTTKYLIPILFLITLISACRKEPEEVIENDVITTIKLSVKDTGSALPAVDYFFRDLDGEGGNSPVTDTFIMHPTTYYEIQLDLSNERQTPAQSVTAEIMANKEEHQLFFTPTPSASLINFMYKDLDANGKPLGLKISYNTQNSPTSGSLEIILRHFPNKNAANVSSGDITNAGGESEVEVDFPFRIE